MNKIRIKSRRAGIFAEEVRFIKEVLMESGSMRIFSLVDNTSYPNRLVKVLKQEYDMDVTFSRQTRKDPTCAHKMVYDQYGEPLGIKYVDQVDKFTGWKFTFHLIKSQATSQPRK